jgi:hypothetical protein
VIRAIPHQLRPGTWILTWELSCHEAAKEAAMFTDMMMPISAVGHWSRRKRGRNVLMEAHMPAFVVPVLIGIPILFVCGYYLIKVVQ